jgi:hypothetical protein
MNKRKLLIPTEIIDVLPVDTFKNDNFLLHQTNILNLNSFKKGKKNYENA